MRTAGYAGGQHLAAGAHGRPAPAHRDLGPGRGGRRGGAGRALRGRRTPYCHRLAPPGAAAHRGRPRQPGQRHRKRAAQRPALRPGGRRDPGAPAGGRRRACLEIEDDGPGVPEKELAYLFEPFYQGAPAAGAPAGGAGLGLSIARAAVAAHKGGSRRAMSRRMA
ncbi:ATP-binding protein [Achromobacter xylosoxidans]